jgi:uncharacterized protein
MIERASKTKIDDALTDTPVVMVVGPRQCGKSTLAKLCGQGMKYITLDDVAYLSHARENPSDFLRAHSAPLIIDEIQRAPELFLPLKKVVDDARKPGSYLLTGSANVLLIPKVADSLAGRMEVVDLLPLSQSELEASPRNWVDDVFSDEYQAYDSVCEGLEERIVAGGFPEPVQRVARRREPWFESYIRTLLDRDVRDMANIEGLTQLPKLLRLLAIRAGTPLNLSGLSRETGLPHTTITRYIDLLKALYLVHTVPAWSADLEVRLARTPKAYLIDTGLACHLNRIDEKAITKEGEARTALLETFVANELQKLIRTAHIGVELHHLRTVKNKEVAFVLEARDGRLVAIDLRQEQIPGADATERLEYVREITGEQFYRGIWMHPGSEAKVLSSRVCAVPIANLWS